jgi:hypothetical protein
MEKTTEGQPAEEENLTDDPKPAFTKSTVAGQSAGADAAGEGDSEGGDLTDKL